MFCMVSTMSSRSHFLGFFTNIYCATWLSKKAYKYKPTHKHTCAHTLVCLYTYVTIIAVIMLG